MSKRLGSPYRSGPSPHWVKVKNPNAPAVKRRRGIGAVNPRGLVDPLLESAETAIAFHLVLQLRRLGLFSLRSCIITFKIN